MDDLIHNKTVEPSFDEITGYIEPPARDWWQEINSFLQEQYGGKPKTV